MAVDRFQRFLRARKYALKFDVRKYFPSIDHEILKAKIERKIKCKRTLSLIELIIDSSNRQEDAGGLMGVDRICASIQRWIGHKQHADTWRLREQVFSTAIFQRGAA